MPQHALLDLAHQAVLLVEREIAARVDDDLAVVRLDRREELDAVAELAVGRSARRPAAATASASVMPGWRSASLTVRM